MLVPLLALIATTIPPVGSSPVTFTIDVSSPITSTPLNLPLLDCVGVGHATLLLRADMQGHITRAAKDIGFKHIRGHGVLDDDMSTFLNGGANMYNVFTLLDFLLSVSIKPILELSFMPAALAADPSKTIMHYKGITSAPADWAAWSNFITEFVSLLVEHYGVEEVRKWRMEVWNEPGYCGVSLSGGGDRGRPFTAFYTVVGNVLTVAFSAFPPPPQSHLFSTVLLPSPFPPQ